MDSDVVLKYIMSVFSLSLVLSCCHVVWMVSLFRSYVVTTYVTDYTFDPSSCTVLYRLSFYCVFICVQYLVLATNGHTTPAPRAP